jgi:hypothetical protein
VRRRTLIAAGLGGTIVLAASGLWYKRKYGEPARTATRTAEARGVFTALVPAVIGAPGGKALTPAQISGAVDRVLATIGGLPLNAQDEVGELLGLLQTGAVRKILAVSSPWNEASPAELAAFLQSWRTHRISLLQVGYHALHDLTAGAFYADETTWSLLAYPGPAVAFS